MTFTRRYSRMTCCFIGWKFNKFESPGNNQQLVKQKKQVIPEWSLSGLLTSAGVISLLFCLSMPPCQAADIRFVGALPGGMIYKKKVVSMRESKFNEIVPQKTDFSCGAAALATILKYGYAEDISEKQIIKEMLKINDPEVIKKKGFSLLDLKNYLKTRGMKGVGYKVKPAVLKILKIPVIVLLDTGGYKHFVVVKKAKNGKVYVSDPALGNKILPEDEFVQGWNGIVFVVLGKPFDEDSPLLALNDPFKVNKENVIKGTQRKIDAIDFGLIPNQLF